MQRTPLVALFEELSEEEKLLLFLRYTRGMTCGEISRSLLVPVDVIERAVERASSKIYRSLRIYEPSESDPAK